MLIHDTQYTDEEYRSRVGWGHSTFDQALSFAAVAGVGQLVTFHHDPGHSDDMLDRTMAELRAKRELTFELTPGQAGLTLSVG